ncbi:YfhO family protein [Planomicrobium sp. CPCC 101110]|uniref:YfhO family protein n=1 Tax=Planomicrobium sp. CPCC 101110 TaxID=2599619 RepID=UPI0011B7EBD3|nr:YfhO family protein [Planomicrobium sp. CPCC 101110]TWT25113.1 YfhO family protein [Planomicrobium sp. CPCC 101110]
MQKFMPYMFFIALCLVVSTASHITYLYEWTQGRFMAGNNDGLSQMLPFKNHLYHQYTSGEFFYSTQLGLGSGTLGWLSYYFATSIFFILTVCLFYLLELGGVIPEPDILFWGRAAVFISIIRLAAVLAIASAVFRYMKFKPIPAFLGSCVYGISGMYFSHTAYWEFFADSYLWLPLLLFGVEKIFRERRSGWFLFAVALSMFDNFYFAYINLLVTGIYTAFRFVMPLEKNETPKSSAIKQFLIAGLVGAGISAVSFVPAAYSFFNNYRPPYAHEISWFDWIDNILFTSSYLVLPAAFVLMVFALPLYKSARFRFFSLLVLLGVVLHYSPLMASAFNGFSAPQYRWEYFVSFAAGGAVAAGFSKLPQLKANHIAIAGVLGLAAYFCFAILDPERDVSIPFLTVIFGIALSIFFLYTRAVQKNSMTGQLMVLIIIIMVISVSGFRFIKAIMENNFDVRLPLYIGVIGVALITFMLFTRAVRDSAKVAQLVVFVVFALILAANGFQYVMLVTSGNTHKVSEELITGPDYDDPEIVNLLTAIEERATDSVYRVEWMESQRNNTPLVQNFRGLSAYSSILNDEVVHFYLNDLEIDMARESVSRITTLGKRTNLHSLLKANYVILRPNNKNIPAGFEQVLAGENFAVFENRYPLPFVRASPLAYSEKELEQEPILLREHAMLKGIVLNNPKTPAPLPPAPKKLAYTAVENNASFDGSILDVTGDSGGLDLALDEPVPEGSDLYISFHLINQKPDDGFTLEVNSYKTSRKWSGSVYKTYIDDLTIRIPADDTIRIQVPRGVYELTELEIYEEPYEVLRQEVEQATQETKAEWNGSRLHAEYAAAEEGDFLVMPVPYEIGWSAKVNGKNTDVLEANYAFSAVAAEEGFNTIELTYRPPYFYRSLFVSLLSLAAAFFCIRKEKRIRRKKTG